MLCQRASMSPVVRHRLPPSARRPLPDGVPTVLAEREDDGPAGRLQRLAHLVVGGDHEAHLRGLVVGSLLLHHFGDEAAQVVLQVVDAPVGIHFRVLLFVAQRARISGAGLRSRPGVDADLQPLGMNIVREGFHVRKFGVGVQHAVGVALAFPSVVDVDVDVAGVFHAGGHDLVGGSADVLVGTLPAK